MMGDDGRWLALVAVTTHFGRGREPDAAQFITEPDEDADVAAAAGAQTATASGSATASGEAGSKRRTCIRVRGVARWRERWGGLACISDEAGLRWHTGGSASRVEATRHNLHTS